MAPCPRPRAEAVRSWRDEHGRRRRRPGRLPRSARARVGRRTVRHRRSPALRGARGGRHGLLAGADRARAAVGAHLHAAHPGGGARDRGRLLREREHQRRHRAQPDRHPQRGLPRPGRHAGRRRHGLAHRVLPGHRGPRRRAHQRDHAELQRDVVRRPGPVLADPGLGPHALPEPLHEHGRERARLRALPSRRRRHRPGARPRRRQLAGGGTQRAVSSLPSGPHRDARGRSLPRPVPRLLPGLRHPHTARLLHHR